MNTIISDIFQIFKYLFTIIYIAIELLCFIVTIIITTLIYLFTLIGKWGKKLVIFIAIGLFCLIIIIILTNAVYNLPALFVYMIGNLGILLADSIGSLRATIMSAGTYLESIFRFLHPKYGIFRHQISKNSLITIRGTGTISLFWP